MTDNETPWLVCLPMVEGLPSPMPSIPERCVVCGGDVSRSLASLAIEGEVRCICLLCARDRQLAERGRMRDEPAVITALIEDGLTLNDIERARTLAERFLRGEL